MTPHEPAGGLSPAGAGYHGFDDEGGGLNLRRYLAAVLRHKWLILGITLLGTGIGFIVTQFMELEYRARATLWIDVMDRHTAQPTPIRPAELLRSYSWVDLLRSNTVLEPAVLEQRLYVRPSTPADRPLFASFELKDRELAGEFRLVVDARGQRFILEDGERNVLQRGAIGEVIGSGVGFEWLPPADALEPGQRIGFTLTRPRDAASQLAAALETRFDREGTFLRLDLTSTDAQLAAATLNAVMERYVDVAAELKREKLDEVAVILEEQLEYAEANLKEAELALEGFRVATITLPGEQATPIAPGLELTTNPAYADFFRMKVEREQLQQERESIQRALARASPDRPLSIEALEVIPSVQRSSELAEALRRLTDQRAELRVLRQRYTDEHPAAQDVAEELAMLERREIPALAQRLTGELRAREAEFDERVGSASEELRAIPGRVIEEARLRRQVGTAENLYTMLKRRVEEARLAAASTIPDIRILDRAEVPTLPVSDERLRILLLAFLGSLGFALAGAVVLDRIDPRLRYPEQVKAELGLPILGAVPHANLSNGGLSGGVAAENEHQIAEAFRTVRMNLLYAHDGVGPLVLTVSSPDQGDGKSFVASNLALAFANQGLATLIIDGDTRRGVLHRLFKLPRKPGLTDWLRGGLDPEAVVQATNHDSLDFIGGGTRTHDGPELLGSPATERLLTRLRERYAVIVVDSPPLRAGVDPFILATVTRNLLLVLRNGVTNRELAGTKLELLDRLPIRLFGAVLNDVPPRGAYSYYAGYSTYIPSYEGYEEVAGRKRGRLGQGKPAAS